MLISSQQLCKAGQNFLVRIRSSDDNPLIPTRKDQSSRAFSCQPSLHVLQNASINSSFIILQGDDDNADSWP